MLILTRSDVRAALGMPAAIEAAAAALAAYSSGDAQVPLRTHVQAPNGVSLYMPGLIKSSGALGAKIVSVFPGNQSAGLPTITALMVLQDAATGAPLAAMDASYLTALRTGAAAGVATKYLAREDAASVLLIGAGAQGRTQLAAVRAVRRVSRVVVSDASPAAAEALARELAAGDLDDGSAAAPHSLEVVPAADPNPHVPGADIIICATTSRRPVFAGALLRPGTHVNAIGAYTPEMQELDECTVRVADRFVCDARDAALKEAGDLVIPLRNGVIEPSRVDAEVGDLVLGRRPGRLTPAEITVYKGVGLAALDLAAAQAVYAAAMGLGIGTEVDILS